MTTVPERPPPPPARDPWWTIPVEITRTAAGLRVRVHWRRLSLMLFALALVGWVGTAAGLYCWVKYQRGFTRARFTDILLPQRWKGYATARGNFYIEQARTELQQGKWPDAIHHLRVGVGAAPANLEGRLTLAQCFVLFDRIELARRLLIEGLPYHHDDPVFLRALFTFLLRYQEDAEVVRITAERLRARPASAAVTQLLALAAAEAHYHRGRLDAAEEIATRYGLLSTKGGMLLASHIDWERGRKEAVLARLREQFRAAPTDAEIFLQLVAFARELGRHDECTRLAHRLQLADPTSKIASLELLRSLHLQGASAAYARESEAFLRDFGADPAALLQLGNLAIETADPALARTVYDRCVAGQFDAGAAAVMVAEALLAANRPRDALTFVHELNAANPPWFKNHQGMLSSMQSIACFALGQRIDGAMYLGNFLAQPALRADYSGAYFLARPDGRAGFLKAVAARLRAAGAPEEARQVLAIVCASDAFDQAALTQLVELDLQLGRSEDLSLNLRRLLGMRRPDVALLRTAQSVLGGDRYLFSPDRDDLLDAIQRTLAGGADPMPAEAAPPAA